MASSPTKLAYFDDMWALESTAVFLSCIQVSLLKAFFLSHNCSILCRWKPNFGIGRRTAAVRWSWMPLFSTPRVVGSRPTRDSSRTVAPISSSWWRTWDWKMDWWEFLIAGTPNLVFFFDCNLGSFLRFFVHNICIWCKFNYLFQCELKWGSWNAYFCIIIKLLSSRSY